MKERLPDAAGRGHHQRLDAGGLPDAAEGRLAHRAVRRLTEQTVQRGAAWKALQGWRAGAGEGRLRPDRAAARRKESAGPAEAWGDREWKAGRIRRAASPPGPQRGAGQRAKRARTEARGGEGRPSADE